MLLRKEFCKGGGGKRKGAPNDQRKARAWRRSCKAGVPVCGGVCAKRGRHGVYIALHNNTTGRDNISP